MKTSNALKMIADAIATIADDDNSDMSSVERTALEAFAGQLRAVAADLDESEKELRQTIRPGSYSGEKS